MNKRAKRSLSMLVVLSALLSPRVFAGAEILTFQFPYITVAFQAEQLKVILLYIHLMAMAAAIGTALLLKQLLFLRTSESHVLIESILKSQQIVTFSLAGLWVSGGLLLLYSYLQDPSFIQNEKIWAKIIIVAIMTFNGWIIERFVVPVLTQVARGKRALFSSQAESIRLRTIAAVSVSGWLMVTFLGLATFMNQGYSWSNILAIFMLLVSCAFVVSFRIVTTDDNM